VTASLGRTLAVAALPFEAGAWSRYADGRRLVVRITGMGSKAAGALEEAIRAERPDRVVGFGLCGGIAPGARTGTLAVPAWVGLEEGCTRMALAALPLLAAEGGMWTVPTVVARPAAKRDLWQRTGASWVDQEAAHWASVCATLDIPCSVVKVVIDGPDAALPTRRDISSWAALPGLPLRAWAARHVLAAVGRRLWCASS
jgi:adenosylhomocysteine nucleosidase